ncbi:MAG: hypothetical protein COT00_00290 [Candidatus Omnitrophica bacterium CG07_land_8_20_14_0_80_50_8]|nr:MAG: hypothetical protein COT00_00290 [Candidatus Omnitrophica bacterium CG07_land_8_20_14_0_80_50_8]
MKKTLGALFLALCLFLFVNANLTVPVLMYHHVGAVSDRSSTNVSVETFERQMEYLKVHRMRVMSLEDFLGHIRLGQGLSWNTVVITFDDGNLDNLTNALPILKRMGFPATIFMITGNIGKDGWLSAEDLRVLDASGIAIGSHTANHVFLPKLKKAEAVLELRQSRNVLEKILGHPVFLFSYPAGGVTEALEALVAREGYHGAVTTNYGCSRNDLYALRRLKITERDGNLFSFFAKVSGLYSLGRRTVDIA